MQWILQVCCQDAAASMDSVSYASDIGIPIENIMFFIFVMLCSFFGRLGDHGSGQLDWNLENPLGGLR